MKDESVFVEHLPDICLAFWESFLIVNLLSVEDEKKSSSERKKFCMKWGVKVLKDVIWTFEEHTPDILMTFLSFV